MSISFRHRIELALARLVKYMAETPGIGCDSKDHQMSLLDQESNLEMMRRQHTLIRAVVSDLTTWDDEWSRLIRSLKGEAQKLEQRLYDGMAIESEGMLQIVDRAREVLAVLEAKINSLETSIKEAKESLTKGGRDESKDTSGQSNRNPRMRQGSLPEIKLVKFGGNPEEWPVFWSSFKYLVETSDYEDTFKLIYLRSLLYGPAYDLIKNYVAKAENYPLVLKILLDNYGSDGKIKWKLRKQLCQLAEVKDNEDPRPTLYALLNILQRLDSINAPVALDELENIIIDKLPSQIMMHIRLEQRKLETWNVEALRNILDDYISIIKEIDTGKEIVSKDRKGQTKVVHNTNKRGNPGDVNRHTTTMAITDTRPIETVKPRVTVNCDVRKAPKRMAAHGIDHQNNVDKGSVRRCLFCGGNHFSDRCAVYTTRTARINRAREAQLCETCLKRGHTKETCRSGIKPCFYCKSREHVSPLCPIQFQRSNSQQVKVDANARSEENQKVALAHQIVEVDEPEVETEVIRGTVMAIRQRRMTSPILACLRTTVSNPENPDLVEETGLFFDQGSEWSYIDEGLATRLRLDMGKSTMMSIMTFNADHPKRMRTCITPVAIVTKLGQEVIEVSTIEGMSEKFTPLKVAKLKEEEGNVEQIGYEYIKPGILIGMDYYPMFAKWNKRKDGLYEMQTVLGTIIVGKESLPANEKVTSVNCLEEVLTPSQYWELETMGITDADSLEEDQKVYQEFKQMVSRERDGRYVVGWPWRTEKVVLSATYHICYRQLQSLLERLRKHYDIKQEYDEVFKYQMQQGIIEVAPETPDGITHYLPHRPVLTPSKSTKLRVVFNASVKGKTGVSLNEALHKGPSMLPHMIGVLLRARCYKQLLVADVEKAFLQIGLYKGSRDVTRFLWVRDINKPLTADNLIVYRYKRVVFGISSSPFLLSAVIRYHLENSKHKLASTVLKNLYADNVIIGGSSNLSIKETSLEVRMLFADAKMNLRKFATNDPKQSLEIPQEYRETQNDISLLGLHWDLRTDKLYMKLHDLPNLPWTKRNIEKFVRKHFDPLGLIAPIFLNWKLLIQELWRKGCDWDEELPNEKIKMTVWNQVFKKWSSTKIEISRYIENSDRANQLHVFVDASSTAYATALYLLGFNGKNYQSNLIYSKTRLLPIKQKLTIPRAELMAAWLGVKALEFVLKHLEVPVEIYAWSDSKCVIGWLKSANTVKLPVFVRNRVNNIKESGIVFSYVPSEENPADIATRGMKLKDFIRSNLWWHGPAWLAEDKSQWPNHTVSADWGLEIQKVFTVRDKTEKLEKLEKIIDFTGIVRWETILRKGTALQKLIAHWRKEKGLSDYELRIRAENMIIKEAQKDISVEEKEKWGLWKDEDGLWRIAGRFELQPHKEKPVYLPRKHEIVKLLMRRAHEKCGHFGIAYTLTEFRSKYWVGKGRSCAKHVIGRNCLKCRRSAAKKFEHPVMAPLPEERLSIASTFENTALDYVGPFYVKATGNKTAKRWICLFTCLAVRAIHLEVVTDLSAETFLSAFNKFTARRGTPKTLYSDNGKQFVAAAKEVSIDWKFITPHAPWKGGVYERMVGLLKSILKKTFGRQLVKENEFSDVIYQAERILNSRPITEVTSEPSRVLRPVDFLNPTISQNKEEIKVGKEVEAIEFVEDAEVLVRRKTKLEQALNKLWSIWQHEYLQYLREITIRNNKESKSGRIREPYIDEVVLLEEKNVPQQLWRLARVMRIERNNQGRISSVVVRVSRDKLKDKVSYLTRPLECIYSLEIPNLKNEEKDDVIRSKADPNIQEEQTEVVSMCIRKVDPENISNTDDTGKGSWWWYMPM